MATGSRSSAEDSFDQSFLATLGHARSQLESRVAFARRRVSEIDAALPRMTARFQTQDCKLMTREREELSKLLQDYESGAAYEALERNLQPFRQAYVEITREVNPRLISETMQQLRMCADPDAVHNAVKDTRTRKPKIPTVETVMKRSRVAHSNGGDIQSGLFLEYMGYKVTGKRALHAVQNTVSEILDATPALPPIASSEEHEQFMAQAPAAGYNVPSESELRTLNSEEEFAKRSRVKERASKIVEAAYNIENIKLELARMRGELSNAVMVVNKDICEGCNRPMVIMAESCLSVCPQCKRARTYIQTSATVRNSSNRGLDGSRIKRHPKNGVFDEFFSRWMGLGKRTEDGIITAIQAAVRELGITHREQISLTLVHFIIESLNADKIMQMKIQIYCRLAGVFPPRMTKDQQTQVNAMRRAIVVPWETMMARTGRKRVTHLCEFTLFKIVQLLGWSHLSEFFALFTGFSTERQLIACDEVWRGVCATYKWEFIPTVMTIPQCAEFLGVREPDMYCAILKLWNGVPQPPMYELSRYLCTSPAAISVRRAVRNVRFADDEEEEEEEEGEEGKEQGEEGKEQGEEGKEQGGDTSKCVFKALKSWKSFDDEFSRPTAPAKPKPRSSSRTAKREVTTAAASNAPPTFEIPPAELKGLTPAQRAGLNAFVRAMRPIPPELLRIDATPNIKPLTGDIKNTYLFSDAIEAIRAHVK